MWSRESRISLDDMPWSPQRLSPKIFGSTPKLAPISLLLMLEERTTFQRRSTFNIYWCLKRVRRKLLHWRWIFRSFIRGIGTTFLQIKLISMVRQQGAFLPCSNYSKAFLIQQLSYCCWKAKCLINKLVCVSEFSGCVDGKAKVKYLSGHPVVSASLQKLSASNCDIKGYFYDNQIIRFSSDRNIATSILATTLQPKMNAKLSK